MMETREIEIECDESAAFTTKFNRDSIYPPSIINIHLPRKTKRNGPSRDS